MTGFIRSLIETVDDTVAWASLGAFRERPALIAFMFHPVFEDADEMQSELVDPMQRTTVEDLEILVRHFVESGYRFLKAGQLAQGIPPNERVAVLSFDDGYFNNHRVLPVLENFDVPATFFIPSNHIRQGKGFWWDALYRERRKRGASIIEIQKETLAMKDLRTEQIECKLRAIFGPGVLAPRNDLDRTFTTSELREFAKHPLVEIGNHTADHAILPNYSQTEVREQIQEAQNWLTQIAGRAPRAIAYPNGAVTPMVVSECQKVGLEVGFTMKPFKAYRASAQLKELGRFAPQGRKSINVQARTMRSDFQLYGKCRQAYLKIFRPNSFS